MDDGGGIFGLESLCGEDLGCWLDEWSITTVEESHVRKWLKVDTSLQGIMILVMKL